MRGHDFITLSTRALVNKTSRTLLTILGMGVGIGAVLFLVSLGFGLRNVLIEEITTDKSFVILDATVKDSGLLKLNKASIEQIKSIEGVKEVSPVQEFPAKAAFDSLNSEVKVLSVAPSFFELSGLDKEIKRGRAFNDDEPLKVVITESLAQLFDDNGVSTIGKTVKLNITVQDTNIPAEKQTEQTDKTEQENTITKHVYRDFKVIGIIAGDLSSTIYVPSVNLSDYANEYSLAKIETVSSDMLQPVREQVLGLGFSVSTISDTVEQANKIFRVVTIVLAVFGAIALTVSAIGMFNTMTITLLERTQEIGVMKSIGASKWDVTFLFLTEATMMGTLGGVAGVAIGLTVSKLINAGFNLMATRFGGEPVAIFYTPPIFIIFIIAFGAIIGLSTGIFPARRAGKIDALEALRYK